MPDRREVIALSAPVDEALRPVLEELREAVGLASSLAVVTLLSANAGVATVGAAGGTTIPGSRTALDFEDARIDELRLVVYGNTTAAATARVVDLTSGTTALCTVTLPVGASAHANGAWTVVDSLGGGTRNLGLQVLGNGAATQTIYHAALHIRTRRLVRK